jgi:hypothetical protein
MSTYRPVNRIAEYANESKELMEGHPVSSVMVAFGLGVATGLVLVTLISESTPQRDQGVAHRLGQHLLEAMSSVLPETISRSFRA